MNTGKTLFAQLMDFLPWTTFTRIVDRYGGDHRVRTLSCAEQYRSMAFAQLTYRESLRDIETCLSVHASKLYHMGFRQPVRRSTLADANERRDWRIHAALAQRLITQAMGLYVDEALGVGPDQYRLRGLERPIALIPSVFRMACAFRTTKAAVKMHTLLEYVGATPRVSSGSSRMVKLHDVHALGRSCRSRSHLRRGSWLREFARRVMVAAPPNRRQDDDSSPPKLEPRCSSRLSRRRRIARPASFATR